MAAWGLGSIMVPALIALGGVRLALIGTGAIVPLVVLTRFSRLLHIDAVATVPVVAIALLRSMRIFRALPVPALEGIARGVIDVSVAGGASIVKQGDPGARYYAIADGTLEVTTAGSSPPSIAAKGSARSRCSTRHRGRRVSPRRPTHCCSRSSANPFSSLSSVTPRARHN